MSKGLLAQILRETANQVQVYQEQMDHFEKEPMMLLTEIFQGKNRFLPVLIHQYGDEALLDIQQYWFQHLFPHLRRYIGLEVIGIHYDQTTFPATIEFYIGEDAVAGMNYVEQLFQQYENPQIVEMKQKLVELEREKEQLQEEMEKKAPAVQNPLVLGGANVIKLADIAMRNKKYKKKAVEQVHSIQRDLLDVEQEIIGLRAEIENHAFLHVEREYTIERLEQRIRQLPGYQIIKEVSELEETDDEDFDAIEGDVLHG